jgi:hypothetical protein
VACGLDRDASAEECAIAHWSPALLHAGLNSHRERGGQWRADCPVPGCGAERALEYDAPGKHVRWKSFCSKHDKDAVRPYLAKLVGPCMPGGGQREAIRHDELIDLALSDMPPMTMRLEMLRLAGLGTADALDRLGVRREHRARVIGGKTGGAPKRVQNRRSLAAPKWATLAAPKWVQRSR